MAENEGQQTTKTEEPKIMCFVSKQMVPQSQMVEVEYGPGRRVWVQARYIRYTSEAKAS